MEEERHRDLLRALEREAASSVRSLAAAERAVIEGRLNVAKVLRAAALASRQRALSLARAADADEPASVAVTEATAAARATQAVVQHVEESAVLDIALRAASSSTGILAKTESALARTTDVPETVVAQFVWVCEECGFTIESQRPEICPSCGSIAGEFALFAPFFSSTSEHIGRRRPEDALAQLEGDADRLAEELAGSDDVLRTRPGEGEWCAKEIAGHMVDIVELASRRVRGAMDPAYTAPAERTMLPWKLLDIEDYPNVAARQIIVRFRNGLEDLAALLRPLKSDDWRKKVDLVSGRTMAVDVASWVANHNVAHLAQIRALLAGAEQ